MGYLKSPAKVTPEALAAMVDRAIEEMVTEKLAQDIPMTEVPPKAVPATAEPAKRKELGE